LAGVWHFHASRAVRVFYYVDGATLWVLMVEKSRGVDATTIRKVRRRRIPVQ
jgi:hypothetical protein